MTEKEDKEKYNDEYKKIKQHLLDKNPHWPEGKITWMAQKQASGQ